MKKMMAGWRDLSSKQTLYPETRMKGDIHQVLSFYEISFCFTHFNYWKKKKIKIVSG